MVLRPHYKTFQEACDLIITGGAYTLNNSVEFSILASKLLNNSEIYTRSSEAAKSYVKKNTGATEIIVKGLEAVIKIGAETEKSLLL